MNVLIIGRGSIGTKHRVTLEKLAPRFKLKLFIFEPTTHGARYFHELESALRAHRIDAAFICNPTSLHVKTTLICARFGAHVFLEKPLAAVWDMPAFKTIERHIKKKNLTFMVGYDMRFNPWLLKVKELLDANTMGDIWGVRIMAGQYLPNWRPGTDYRKGYGAKKVLGGGVLLDLSHELDYLLWFVPKKIKTVFARTMRTGMLAIETEDIANVVIEYADRSVAHLHLDYLTIPYRRSLEMYGTAGTLLWDDNAQTIRVHTRGRWKTFTVPMTRAAGSAVFLQELTHFFTCIRSGKNPRNSLAESVAVMRLVDTASRSARTGTALPLTV